MEPVLRFDPGGSQRTAPADAAKKAADAAELKRAIGSLEAAARGPDAPWPTDPQEFRSLVQRAHRGDESVLPAVRAMLKSAPKEAIRLFGGDLATQGLDQLLFRCYPKSAQRAALHAELQRRHAELAGEAPTPIETMLVEQAVRCWLQAEIADSVVAEFTKGDMRQHRLLTQRQDAAHRRLNTALKTLATVRRLALPVLKLHMLDPAKTASAAG